MPEQGGARGDRRVDSRDSVADQRDAQAVEDYVVPAGHPKVFVWSDSEQPELDQGPAKGRRRRTDAAISRASAMGSGWSLTSWKVSPTSGSSTTL